MHLYCYFERRHKNLICEHWKSFVFHENPRIIIPDLSLSPAEDVYLFSRWHPAQNEQSSHQKLRVDVIFWSVQLIGQVVDGIMFVQIQHVKRAFLAKQICIVKRKWTIVYNKSSIILIYCSSHAQEQPPGSEMTANTSAKSDGNKCTYLKYVYDLFFFSWWEWYSR